MDDGCAGILLAGGAGTRYGRPKVLAENGAWLRSAVSALRDGGCAPVYVVLGATGPAQPAPGGGWLISRKPDIALPPGARPVWAADWAVGLSASLRAGILAAANDPVGYAAILPVDTPDVGADVVARVLGVARNAPSGLARAVFHGQPGHPVLLSKTEWSPILKSTQNDVGARTFLAARTDMVAVTCDDLATGYDRDYPGSTRGDRSFM
ncbi:nucleotidyltransferase family protein [Nocardia stercoris]|uniref:Nucleotidyltransferase family protein n=1 Tax=Nocardia stercoris TaxID=2483361 RepID=A0A3M2L019_9NOCA|nr:nucleotidyltransferase family protein [Nocardia stercoris]RMI31022.1 nucleotidyltransferase family protein [Nocardia stercoris]